MEKMDLKNINLREYALSKDNDKLRHELINELENIPVIDISGFLENFDNFQVFMELFQNNWVLFSNKLRLINTIMEILAKKNINFILKYALNNQDFHDLFNNAAGSFKFLINDFDYDILKIYLQRSSPIVFQKFLVNENYFKKLIYDDLSDSIIKQLIITYHYSETINDFFRNSRKASIIFDELEFMDIVFLIKRGVNFPRDYYLTTRFFNKLKTNSIISFRNNVNFITYILGDLQIERKLEEYYDTLLKSYNRETGYFSIYNSLVEGKMLPKEEYGLLWHRGINGDTKLLKDISNKKISEIVIDYLFKDNIYNVWINIREMLRYDSYKKNALLSSFTRNIFKKVIMIDELSPSDKLAFLEEYKDKRIDSLYYDSFNLLKKASYKEMNDVLLKIDGNDDKKLLKKYGTFVYDYRGRPFYMVVRSLWAPWTEKNHNSYDCYSLISNENTQIYEGYYTYGYDNIDLNSIIHHFEADSFSFSDDNSFTTKNINRIMTPREIVMSNNFYSELQIKNRKVKRTKNTFITQKPSYIVAIGVVNKKIVDESKRLNIPIVLIKSNVLDTTMGHEYVENKSDYEYVYDAREEYEKNSKR